MKRYPSSVRARGAGLRAALRARLRRFARDRRGAATVWALLWTFGALMVGGVAIDTANAYRLRAQMQATADSAALAAAIKLPDMAAARSAARSLAAINMPPEAHGNVLVDADVVGGHRDADSGAFVAGGADADAVRVTVRRQTASGNAAPTFLLDLVGLDAWDIAVDAVAGRRETTSGPGTPGDVCSNAMILSADSVQAGGGNTYRDGICIHGEKGAHFGGGDYFEPGVKVSAADIDDIYIGDVVDGSVPGEDVKSEMSREMKVVPTLDEKFDDLWADLWNSGATTYSGGLLPDYLYNSAGYAHVVRVDRGWWTVQPGELQPYHIYVVNHGIQLAGGVDANNVAIIARGQIGIGGGNLSFEDVFFFGDGQLNFSGSVTWGDPDHYCALGRFNVYLLSTARLGMGGWGSGGVYGVLAAADTVAPGGAMRSAGGLYIESRKTIQLGGNVDIEGCGSELESFYDLGPSDGGGGSVVVGSRLVR